MSRTTENKAKKIQNMLNLLNRKAQRQLFATENQALLISFLNEGFFPDSEKVANILQVDDLADSLIHFQSCFQETIACKVKTTENRVLLVQVVVLTIHNGKDATYIKLKKEYFDIVLRLKSSYAYQLSVLYIGLFTFDFGESNSHYHFKKSVNNYPLDIHLLNLKKWDKPKKENWTVFDQWLFLLKESKTLTAVPSSINHPILWKVLDILDTANWSAEELEDYQYYENQWTERINRILAVYKEINSPIIEKYRAQPATKASLSTTPLFIQLTPPKITINIDHFPKATRQKTAFTIFRSWLQQIQKAYPKLTIIIKDERPIVQDFNDTLTRALKHLILSDKFYTRFRNGWDIGYVQGFMAGSLNTLWHYEYVIKQTDNFKTLTALQVIRDYIKFNDTLKLQLSDLYLSLIHI